jgi:hypothetical protein
MHDPARVCKRNGVAHAKEDAQTLAARPQQRRIGETRTSHQAHQVVRSTVGQRPRIVDGGDARVFETCKHSGFPRQSLRKIRCFRIKRQHLECDITIQQPVVHRVHASHPALPDE